MELPILVIISLTLTILFSLLFGNLYYRKKMARKQADLDEKYKSMVREAELQAENIKKDKIIEAKEKLLKMKQEFEEEANRKKNQIISNEQKIKQREAQISRELEQLKELKRLGE